MTLTPDPDTRRPIPVLVGPTGIGKTAVAHALARIAEIEIVSADSRQVYRGLDIGTAKPTAAERAQFRYHLLDVVDPSERYSAGLFSRDAAFAIRDIRTRGKLPLVAGGTGFYLRALFEGLFEEPALDEDRRERLRDVLSRMPGPEQVRWAERLDAAHAGGGSQRAVRAIEVALLAGAPLSRLHETHAPPLTDESPWYVRLELPRDVLRRRLAERVDNMLAAGLVQEVHALLASGLSPEAPGLTGVGYAQVVAHLAGQMTRAELAPAIVIASGQYAKRQDTWFRHQIAPALVLDATQDAATLAKALLDGYRAALEQASGPGIRRQASNGSMTPPAPTLTPGPDA